MKLIFALIAIVLASTMAKGIDVSFSSSDGVNVNLDTSGLVLDFDDELTINGEMWNGERSYTDNSGSMINETWRYGNLHKKEITYLNGTKFTILETV